MQLTELLDAASRGLDRATAGLYDPLDNHWAIENGVIKSNALCRPSGGGIQCGDELGHVAVEEIIETYEPHWTDFKQVHEAARVIEQMALNLLGIAYEIRALDMATVVSSPASSSGPRVA